MTAAPVVLRGVVLHALPRPLVWPPRAAADEPAGAAPSDAALREAYEGAFARGLEDGREEGRARGLAEARAIVDEAMESARRELEAKHAAATERQAQAHAAAMARLEGWLAGLPAAFAQRVDELEREAVALAYDAVCRIAGAAATSPERLAGVVAQAWQQVRAGPVLQVRLGEADWALLDGSEAGRALQARHPGVTWRADPTMRDGGCVLDLAHGSVDARLGVQLERLRALWAATASAPEDRPDDADCGEAPCPA